jgi:hypothetical protein
MISELRVWPIWKELKHFTVSAACEDSSSNARTEEFCRGLIKDLSWDCKVVRHTWYFNQLCVPELRAITASEAASAQLIIISVHHFEILPDGVKDWIRLWLGQRNNQSLVLLALLDPVYEGFSRALEGYLQDVAKRADMEFLVAAEDSREALT